MPSGRRRERHRRLAGRQFVGDGATPHRFGQRQADISEAVGDDAVAQIGVHLVFFLHLTTVPDNTNNVLALAFGVLIVALIIGGSVWIMDHMNARMMPMDQMMKMQR